MINYLMVNDVIRYSDDSYIRIVWMENDNSFCYVVKLLVKKLDIVYISINEILEDLNRGNAKIVEDNFVNITEENISDKEKQLLIKANSIVEDIFSDDNEPDCYSIKNRRKIILKVAEKHGISEKTVYKYMRKYLQGGKVKYALLSDLNKCGGKGKDKKSTIIKRGRPHFITNITEESIGINVDEDIKKIFKIALSRYYKNTKQRSLVKTYRMMLKDFFSYEIKNEDNMVKRIKTMNEIPSLNQFKYWFYKNEDNEKVLRSRIGDKKVDLNYRRLKSDSIYETMGPGSRYQIDATIGDVYLVSSIDRKSVIGRPVVYLIIDVFSRMITGVNVALEGPSWNGASTALYNCMEDKVQYCKKFGIDVKEEDWNVKGMPNVLIADRGEMVGPIAENVIKNLKISIENTPSYMGCAKGIVEQYFHVINSEIKHWLPGEVKKEYRERGEKDYRKEATLDIIEFTRLIILTVIKRNKTIMKDYPLTQEMINDDVKPTPEAIWNWGLKNRTGNLRTLPKKILISSLLKRGKATIQREGIKFQGLLYSCLIAEEQNWFFNAQIKGRRSIEVRYDDRDSSNIYLMLTEDNVIKAELISEKTSNLIFIGKTFQEVEDYKYNKTIKNSEYTDETNNLNLNLDLEIEKIVKKSEEKSFNGKNVLIDIRENRKIENEEHRKNQALINEKTKVDLTLKELEENEFSINSNNQGDEVKNNLLKRLQKLRRES